MLRKIANGVVFECFEVSPTVEVVMESQASLRRIFPGRSILIPASMFHNFKFARELADFLQRLDSEQVDMVKPNSRKAKVDVIESRDSVNPRLFTELLMTILAPYGSFIQTEIIQKRTRDDVCWKNALNPWRRSPTWTTLKVAVQLVLANSGLPNALGQYKNFMIFLISELSEVGRVQKLPTDLLYVINAKAGRRASKSGSDIFDFVGGFAMQAVQRARAYLEKNFHAVQRTESIKINLINPSLADRALSLNTSRPYLTKALERTLNYRTRDVFSLSTLVRLNHLDVELALLDFSRVPMENRIFLLADFEGWVRDHLQLWLGGGETENWGWAEGSEKLRIKELHTSNDCQSLKSLISTYEAASRQAYKNNPEQLSLMLLTITELWCSLDIIAIELFPLLEQYAPEIPTHTLRPLLLPRREQLVRIYQIERYLVKRHLMANDSFPSIFGYIGSKSLSVQHFNSSEKLQNLRNKIEDDATKIREAKAVELEQKTASYMALEAEASELEHEMRISWGRQVHSWYCRKCKLTKHAEAIEITVHEWPLPVSDHQAKACVFELRCPE